jgi:hypothetical protein
MIAGEELAEGAGLVPDLLLAMAAIVLSWAVLSGVFVGIGLGVRRAFGLPRFDLDDCFLAFWMGFGFVIFLLQLWHFALPIDGRSLIAVAGLGSAGLLWNRRGLVEFMRGMGARRSRSFALAAICIWLANRASGPCGDYDSGMYHIPAVRWANAFPVVPGLANLHDRLALNSSGLLYDAMLNVGPWAGRAQHLANGLLLLAFLSQLVLALFHWLASDAAPVHLYRLLLLAPVLQFVLGWHVSSFTTDVPPTLVLFAASALLLSQAVEREGDAREDAYRTIAIATLLVLAVCLKLSAAGYAVTAWLVTLAAWLARHKIPASLRRKTFAWILSSAAMLSLPWAARGVVLSGLPAFPSVVGALPVAWRVPLEQAQAESAFITHFGRYFYDLRAMPRFGWSWVRPWAENLPRLDVLLPFGLAFVTVCVYRLHRHARAPIRPNRLQWLLLVPVITGMVAWFLLSPNPRFGSFLFWILAATCAAVLFPPSPNNRGTILVACCLVGTLPISVPILAASLGSQLNLLGAARQVLLIPPGRDHGLQPLNPYELRTYVTESGLVLYVPVVQNACWDAPLPCTPHPAPNLRLAGPGLASGFVVVGPWQALRWPRPGFDFLNEWRAQRAQPRADDRD